ncbi:hypothetical protein BJX62DRAFT_241135 [Aspergillus germanicus]
MLRARLNGVLGEILVRFDDISGNAAELLRLFETGAEILRRLIDRDQEYQTPYTLVEPVITEVTRENLERIPQLEGTIRLNDDTNSMKSETQEALPIHSHVGLVHDDYVVPQHMPDILDDVTTAAEAFTELQDYFGSHEGSVQGDKVRHSRGKEAAGRAFDGPGLEEP